jgi:hypothetical protein
MAHITSPILTRKENSIMLPNIGQTFFDSTALGCMMIDGIL